MHNLKGQIARFLLDFTSRFVPISEARIATFGGRGEEPKAWQERGVPAKNGWLLERSNRLSGGLIRGFPYHTHNQLQTFPQILKGYGEGHYLDLFHFDLCGTLTDSAIADFVPVLPLVLKSRGKCFAITVADARRNLVLEEWPEYKRRALGLFGTRTYEYHREIEATQHKIPVREDARFVKPFDPEKAAKREFGLMVELAEILRDCGLQFMPSEIVRYVYVSRYAGRPFRMRTYFFHFDEARKFSCRAFARTWIESRLSFANGDGFHEIQAAIPRKARAVRKIRYANPTKGNKIMPGSQLARVMREIGGPLEQEYLALAAKASNYDKVEPLVKAFRSLPEVGELGLASVTAEAGSLEKPPRAHASERKHRMKWDDLSPEEQIKWQIEAAELHASSNGDWRARYKEFIVEKFGYMNNDLRYSLRAAFSQTRGKLRKKLRGRIEKVFGDKAGPYLDRLDKLPA
ncbi:MAG TPA: hypothetical protein VFT82_03795 [Candidatus Paceibacterota bacterium]|nr:hypothetical protein [Candidatus Paceibacterota bacterium]